MTLLIPEVPDEPSVREPSFREEKISMSAISESKHEISIEYFNASIQTNILETNNAGWQTLQETKVTYEAEIQTDPIYEPISTNENIEPRLDNNQSVSGKLSKVYQKIYVEWKLSIISHASKEQPVDSNSPISDVFQSLQQLLNIIQESSDTDLKSKISDASDLFKANAVALIDIILELRSKVKKLNKKRCKA